MARLRVVTSEPLEVRFDVTAVVSFDEYRRKIVAFARKARDFYWAEGPRSVEDWERSFHDRFWAEFDERLTRAETERAL